MDCPICQNPLFGVAKRLKVTSCGHLFHDDCIGKAVKKGISNCPSCKYRMMNRTARIVWGNDGLDNRGDLPDEVLPRHEVVQPNVEAEGLPPAIVQLNVDAGERNAPPAENNVAIEADPVQEVAMENETNEIYDIGQNIGMLPNPQPIRPELEAEGLPSAIVQLNADAGEKNAPPAENNIATEADPVQEVAMENKTNGIYNIGQNIGMLPNQQPIRPEPRAQFESIGPQVQLQGGDPVQEAVMENEMNKTVLIGHSANGSTSPNHQPGPSGRQVRLENIDRQVGLQSATPARRSRRANSLGDRVHLYQEPMVHGGVQFRRSNRIRNSIERLNYDWIQCSVCKKKFQHFNPGHLYDMNTACSFECFHKTG